MVFKFRVSHLFLSLSLALALRTLFSRSTSAGSRFVDALPDRRSDPDLLNADADDDDGREDRLANRADPIRLKPPVDDVGLDYVQIKVSFHGTSSGVVKRNWILGQHQNSLSLGE